MAEMMIKSARRTPGRSGPVKLKGQGPVTKQPKSGGQTGHRDTGVQGAPLSLRRDTRRHATWRRAVHS